MAAFEQIYKLYWKRLYAMAAAKLQSSEEAEEIVQELFTTLWEKRNILIITNLSHYLFSSVRHRVINTVRSKVVHKSYWEFYRSFIPSSNSSTEEVVQYNDLSKAFENAVNALPEKSQAIFRLSRFEGKSVQEIAKSLKLSEKAIEYHVTKSLKVLKVQLKDFIYLILFLLY